MTEEQARTAQAQGREFPETMAILVRVREALAARLFLTAVGDSAVREDIYTRVQALDALRDEMAAILAANASERAIEEYAESVANNRAEIVPADRIPEGEPMPPDAPAADSSFLSIDQAVANLDAADVERDKEAPDEPVAASSEEPNTEAEPAAEDANGPETATDDENAETEDGETEGDEPEQAAVEPPRFWDAEAKKRFGELPRDLQELVLSKETERDTATAKAIEAAALKRKAADGEASRIAQLNGVLDKLLPQAIETFKSRWEGVDWNAVIDTHGADQALKLRNQMEQEQVQVQQLTAAKAEAENVQFAKFVEAETAKLPELCPDLVDAKLGNERKQALGKFLIESGVPADSLRYMSALETSIAYDAMLFRQAKAEAKAKLSAPKPVPKPAAVLKPSVRPTASPARGSSPQQARIQALSKKSSLTIDEAVELMDLQET